MIGAYRDKMTLYLLLEMVHGGELFRYLDQKGRLQEQTAAFYAANVFLALEHLHEKGIIHRDLKPENLLIDQYGYIKLVDFGFAKHVCPQLRTTVLENPISTPPPPVAAPYVRLTVCVCVCVCVGTMHHTRLAPT
jgi:serine/threonine protein kinase